MSVETHIETDEEYLARKHKQYYSHLTYGEFIVNEKLEGIHVALQELQNEFDIPNDSCHLENAIKIVESKTKEAD